MVATILVRRIASQGIGSSGVSSGQVAAYHPFVLGPSRPFPRTGARARIAHFGGGFEQGTVIAVHEEGRRVEVRGEGGEIAEFVLSRSTARFVSAKSPHGPRLELLAEPT